MPLKCEDLLDEILADLKVSSSTFDEFCQGTSDSRRFLSAVRDLSGKCKDWKSFKSLLEEARETRRTEKPRGVEQRKRWVPWDAKKAKDIWDQKQAQSANVSDIARDQKIHIIFCGMSRYDDLCTESSDFICISIRPDYGHYEGGFLQRFTREFLENLERELGRGLVASAGSYYLVHQNVVAMVAAGESGPVSAEFRNMKWVSDMVAVHGFAGHVAGIYAHKVVIYAPWESGHICDDIAQKFHLQIQEATAFHTNLRVYPNREEKDAAGLKLTDIATLERIAGDPATPSAFSCRPRTCFGRGECTMAGWSTDMVLKRNFSCGSRDVRFVDGNSGPSWSVLACIGHEPRQGRAQNGNKRKGGRRKGEKGKGEKGKDDKSTWFHQECITRLKNWGEIRVFIIGGRIVLRAFTQPVQGKDDSLYVRPLMESDFSWYSKDDGGKWKEKWKELDEFCLFTYHVIMKSSQQSFESVHVGLRLDVGVSDDGHLFVNEPSRWYVADWFSIQLCGRDLTVTAQQFGKAFAEYLLTT